MNFRFALSTVLVGLLLLGIAVYAGRLLTATGVRGLDLAGDEITSLASQTVAQLEALKHELSITYFVSTRERMPSHLKGLEEQVRSLLAALQAQAPARLSYRVIYPEAEEGAPGTTYAAQRKASAFSVRRVLQDEQRGQPVWSSLALAYGEFPEVLIQGIETAHLPYLEELILTQVRALEEPLRPTLAVAAPAHFELLPAFLGEYGQVLRVDLDRQPAIPLEADVLFWMQPQTVTPEHLRQLHRFVDSGRTAVLAGSSYRIGYREENEEIRYQAYRLPDAWETLLRPLGLRPLPDLLMDRNQGPVLIDLGAGQVRAVEAPFQLRCLPGFYNLRSFLGPARGGLNFTAASALELDPRQLAAAGFRAEVVGTTTEHAWVAPLPEVPVDPADLQTGLRVPKQHLMVLLKTDDPWRGEVFVLASASPFQDGIINQPGYAHQLFLRTLVHTFVEPQRLARLRVSRRTPQPLPPLGPGARAFWRVWAALLAPGLLLALGVRQYFGTAARPTPRAVRQAAGWLAGGLALLLLIGQFGRAANRWYLDLTADQLNRPAPLTRRLLARAAADGLQAELFSTAPAAMPPRLKRLEPRIRAVLAQGGVALRTIRPEQLSAQEQAALGAEDLEPFLAEQVIHDTLATRQVWSGLRLRQGERTTIVPRLDEKTIDHLDFLLTAALRRLEQGRAPRLAIVSDLPRLSPAEALEDYQRKGLTPPSGADVYSHVKALLAEYGYQLDHLDPRAPRLREGTDALLWLQPRRDSTPVALKLAEWLASGGQAIVALQHFNIQQRQYRGAGFETVYWPQPQFQDLNPYLQLLGVEQVREVLMDRTQSHLALDTQINRTAVREYDPQQVALPFLIRGVGAHYASHSPITRRLGDLLFIWGNHFGLDRARLDALGLRAEVLISTSERAWTYPWQGGWLPPESFAPTQYLPGPQPLVVRLEGHFPAVALHSRDDGRPVWAVEPKAPAAAGGTLLLIGCSEMFKNDHLYTPEFQHDQLLLNAVASLVHGERLAELQARRPLRRGFSFQPPVVKTAWRLAVIGSGPLAFLGYGLYRRRQDSRQEDRS